MVVVVIFVFVSSNTQIKMLSVDRLKLIILILNSNLTMLFSSSCVWKYPSCCMEEKEQSPFSQYFGQ